MNKGLKIFGLAMAASFIGAVAAIELYQKKTEPRRRAKEEFINEIPSLDEKIKDED